MTKDGDNIIIKIDDEETFRRPLHLFEDIVCFNYAGASPALMYACSKNNIGLSFMSESGRFLARVWGETKGNVLLRRQQYRYADDDLVSLDIAKNMILSKLINSRSAIKRCIREHAQSVDINGLQDSIDFLNHSIKRCNESVDFDFLRGIEGEAAHVYFMALDNLIIHQKEYFYMSKRSKRPPLDNFNSLISFLYTILSHDVQSALECVGLDPYVGFFHTERPGRASLALDVMEEFRTYLVDKLAVSLINKKQINEKGFIKKESGGVVINEETKKTIINAWQNRKRDVITHPYLGEKVEIGLLPYIQAMMLARFVRGDLEAYPPFFSG